ncbi:hypothetical protein I7V28_22635 [Lelliottia amnigena]|jgi:DNA-binding NarL/FixJ family response regulator|uniref:LuxR C-terminal-related transcriptional regulator n=1 Tax=Lelliottia TaxID=1330545 RepID=UPI00192B0629|nr:MULTISPECIES: LuxR C-terminal-related transcriptional regulator [Lelliottia]MBL5884883.1 hypothetical protein [Lelliottia aquatilis]MBL5923870.1 hypothetical protein [Lelliottia amnigena]MBL5932715.1 hypothetical protein [Lelliottia amnigena]
MINIVIITDNHYFAIGLIKCIHDVFNDDFVIISRTNFENYKHHMIDLDDGIKSYFKNIILCEKDVYSILKNSSCVPNYKIIDASKSVNELYRNLSFDGDANQSYVNKKLSPRELTVCKLFKNCETDDKIAADLRISKKTLSCHRRNIISKLKLKNKKQLYLFCQAL